MIPVSAELGDILLWDWDAGDPRLSMPDSANRPSRTVAKAVEQRLEVTERDVAQLKGSISKSATKAELDSLRSSVEGLRTSVDKLAKNIDDFTKKGFWKSFWLERNWSIPVSLVVLGFIASGLVWLIDVYIERHISSAQAQLSKEIGNVESKLSTQIVALDKRLSVIEIARASQVVLQLRDASSIVVKQHNEEILQVKDALASKSVQQLPQYWPTALSIVNLASIAAAPPMAIDLHTANTLTNVSGVTFGPSITNVILQGRIEHCHFRNIVVVFDPSVVLIDDLFVNCIFVFLNVGNPPPSIKRIGSGLLQSKDVSSVKLTSG